MQARVTWSVPQQSSAVFEAKFTIRCRGYSRFLGEVDRGLNKKASTAGASYAMEHGPIYIVDFVPAISWTRTKMPRKRICKPPNAARMISKRERNRSLSTASILIAYKISKFKPFLCSLRTWWRLCNEEVPMQRRKLKIRTSWLSIEKCISTDYSLS